MARHHAHIAFGARHRDHIGLGREQQALRRDQIERYFLSHPATHLSRPACPGHPSVPAQRPNWMARMKRAMTVFDQAALALVSAAIFWALAATSSMAPTM